MPAFILLIGLVYSLGEMRLIVGLMAVFAAAILIGTGGAMLASVTNYRTQAVVDQFVVTTAGNTTADVQLTSNLFESNKTLLSVASNTTADSPVLGTYTDANRNLALTNLATNTTRTVTLNYRTAGLSDYPQAETASKTLPILLVVSVLFVSVGACIYIVMG